MILGGLFMARWEVSDPGGPATGGKRMKGRLSMNDVQFVFGSAAWARDNGSLRERTR
jgi:hypothetical protein